MRLLVALSTPAEGLSQLTPQFRKPRLRFDSSPHAHLSPPSLQKHGAWRRSLVALLWPPWFLRAPSQTHSATLTFSFDHALFLPLTCTHSDTFTFGYVPNSWHSHSVMFSVLHPHLIKITPSRLPIHLHQQCCPPPPTLNYNHMWLNLRFCTYGIILHCHSHPLMLNSLHWDARLLVTFMHAWKHQISSFILTAEWFLVFLSATQRAPTFYQGTERLAAPVERRLPRKSPWILILYLPKNVCCGCFSFSTLAGMKIGVPFHKMLGTRNKR